MLRKIVAALVLIATGSGLTWLLIRQSVKNQQAEADRRVAVADSTRLADSASYVLFRKTQDNMYEAQHRESARLKSQVTSRQDSIAVLDSLLALATTAEQQVPILTEQRDLAQRALVDAVARGDSLEQQLLEAVTAEREAADSVIAAMRRSGEARENALRTQITDLTVKLNAPTRKFLGFLPMPTCTAGYGVQVEPKIPIHASHGFQATCGAKITLRL